ncbi:polysaccharide deacetylase family protein [Woodsholea maritima]|uniref:polysaccharide deacetylase family protein n=1 Tax=Woodsholea maritima TaxID=240237 RepID=UPI00036E8951|nr:polysaccharide deacetylase family protein [Woodsholea maritima]
MSPAPYRPRGALMGKLQRAQVRLGGKIALPLHPGERRISFSFDDFPRSAGTTAADILEQRGMRATYYVSACFAGEDTHLGAMYETEDLTRLYAKGHEIACHTYSHGDASQMRLAALETDIERNARALKDQGYDGPLESFAFPYGEASLEAKAALTQRFTNLRGIYPGINKTPADRGLLRATPLDGGDEGLKKALAQIDALRHSPGWLIFYGHDVRDTHSPWGCSPEFLETVANAVQASKIPVQTVTAACQDLSAR